MKKFILGKGGKAIVNAEQVQAVYIYEDEDMNERGDFVSTGIFKVNVMLCDQEDRISLAKFDGSDAGENLRALKNIWRNLSTN